MVKRIERTKETEREIVEDEFVLEGWLATLGTDPDIRCVYVHRQADNGSWPRLGKVILLPPFDQDLGPLFEIHGDGNYKFVAVDNRGRLKTARTLPVIGYAGGQAGAGRLGAMGGRDGQMDEVMQETIRTLRHQVQMTMLTKTLERLEGRQPQGGAGPAGAELSTEERAVLHEEALDRSLERVAKLKALIGESARSDPLDVVVKVMGLVKSSAPAKTGGSEMIAAIREVLEIADLVRGGEESGWGIARDVLRSPELHETIRGILARRPQPARPSGRPEPLPAGATAPPPPRPAPAPPAQPVTVIPPPAPPEANGRNAWDILKQEIIPRFLAAAAAGDRNFAGYAELVDRWLPPQGEKPGALEDFVSTEFEIALDRLAILEPRVKEPTVRAWLAEFYHYVQEEYFLPDKEATDGSAGSGAGREGAA